MKIEDYEGKPLPCPFCGSDVLGMAEAVDKLGDDLMPPRIQCLSCGAIGPFAKRIISENTPIELWNRRHGCCYDLPERARAGRNHE